MMNIRSKLLGLVLMLMCMFVATEATAKPKQAKVYIFGVSTNYTDSVTFLTDIQILSPAYIESKTGFLYDRSIYSQQLQLWIEAIKDMPSTTCTIFFSKNRGKLEKKFLKIQNKLRKDQSTKVRPLEAGEFKFVPQQWTEHEAL